MFLECHKHCTILIFYFKSNLFNYYIDLICFGKHMKCYLFCLKLWLLLGQPKQQVDVTQANDGDIQSESIEGLLSKGSHLMMGISKEKSLRAHHQ